MDHFLDKLLHPQSIAVYGANNNIQTMGTNQLVNIIDNGFKGKIFPIHRKLDKVLGYPAYKSIADVPEVPDLALLTLPTRAVAGVLDELGQKGVKSVIITSAGFRETSNFDGEKQIKQIAKKYGIRFIGPNCIGFLNTQIIFNESLTTFNCTYQTYGGKPGNVSIASQSGTFTCHIFMICEERDLRLNKAISIGNEANVDICDCLEYLGKDPTTDVICLYIEEIKRGRKFIEIASKISKKKPIIAIYVGGTEGGSRAVASHTGSMAGQDTIFDAVFEKAGIVRVYNMEEMFDTAVLMSKYIPLKIIPKGKRVAVITNSGGPGATMADRASRCGLEIPEFSEELQGKLSKFLPHTASISNPVDFTFVMSPAVYYKNVPRIVCKSGEVDAYICYGAYSDKYFSYQDFGEKLKQTPMIQEGLEAYRGLIESSIDFAVKISKRTGVPIVFVNLMGLKDPLFNILNKKGFPTYKMPHQAVNAMNNFIKYGELKRKLE